MADELPPVGGEGTETVVPETVPEETPVTGSEEGEREPGGDTPQDVYRRKLYREAKQARREAQVEREARIAAEARAQALEEKRTDPAEPKRYTPQEVQTAVDSGQITAADGADYLARLRATEIWDQRERERESKVVAERPLHRATSEIGEYLKVAPYLADDGDERTQGIARERTRLIRESGLPDNHVTTALAIRLALGPSDKLQKQREVSELTRRGTGTHAESPAGGGGSGGRSAKVDLSKAPVTMVAAWDSEGVDQATRERRYGIYLDLKARKSVR